MMQAKQFSIAISLVLALGWLHPVSADEPQLGRVVAVEEARSLYGRYRIVFTLRAPLPPLTDGRLPVSVVLGSTKLVFPPGSEVQSPLHGYLDELPPGVSTLQLRALMPSGSSVDRKTVSEVEVDCRKLLVESIPAPGAFEAAHVQRSKTPFDLVAALKTADAVVHANFIRFDLDPADASRKLRVFQVKSGLTGRAPAADAQLILLSRPDGLEFELGGEYVLFLHRSRSGNWNESEFQAVRIWRPENDPVLALIAKAQGRPLDTSPRDETAARTARDFYVETLQSPAAIVRYTAAEQLRILNSAPGGALTAVQIGQVTQRAAIEPSAEVSAALRALVESRKP